MTVVLTCSNPACGKTFERPASQADRRGTPACSRACYRTIAGVTPTKASTRCILCGLKSGSRDARCDACAAAGRCMVCGAPGDPTTRGRGEKAARYCLTHDELCGDEGLFKLWRHSFGELRGRAREAAGRAFIVAAGLEGPTLWHRTKRRDL